MKLSFPYFLKVSIFPLLLLLACQNGTQKDLADFVIHPQFQLERVAAEPLVLDPVDMEFDEHGNAYVLEMPGYPLSDAESRLVLLLDKDEDGRFDERKVFADGLGVACSFMPYRDGMLVAAPPELIWLIDTDGDHRADVREVIMGGFGVDNLQHNYNGLTYALNNWIYGSNGGNAEAPYFLSDSSRRVNLRGADFRFRIESEEIERIGRTDWGFELTFDSWGHLFITHNLRHISQLVFEQKYIEGLPTEPSYTRTVISDHEKDGLGRIYPIGAQDTRVNHPEQSGYFSGSCGITFYGGNEFPEGFNESVFVADVVLNLVHLDILSEKDAAYSASRKREGVEFLASTDRAFRPVNMTVGPDGSLYLVDMHREVIEHPEWIPDEIEENLDLTAGRDKGRIYRITPKEGFQGKAETLNRNNTQQLVKALESSNQWTRINAQRLLVENGKEDAVPLLEALLDETVSARARVHALWTLEGLEGLTTENLSKGLEDEEAGVRENALQIAEHRLEGNSELLDKILILTTDKDGRVRMQAALTLSTLDDGTYAAQSSDISDALTALLAEHESDEWTSMAVASAVRRQPLEFCQKSLAATKNGLNTGQSRTLHTLFRWAGKQGNTEGMIGLIAGKTNLSGEEKVEMLEALAEGWRLGNNGSNASPNTLAALRKLEKQGDLAVLRAAGKLRKVMRLPVSSRIRSSMAQARTSVLDKEHSLEERLEYLQLAGLGDFSQRESLLYQLLDNREPVALQTAALQQLWEANEPRVAKQLLKLWPSLGPEARKLAGNILLYKSHNHDLLLTALEEGNINPGELNLDLERRRVLLFSDDDEVQQRAEALFSDAGVVTRKEAIAEMRPALELSGDIAKGQDVFVSLCSNCHKYGEIGQEVGPVLTEIHRKSKEALLYEILDPNAAVDTKFLNHQVKTKDGNLYLGIIHEESDTEVKLGMIGGQEMTLNKNDIEELSSLGISFMPEGLEAGMDHESMADLLAFLQQGF